MIDRNLRSRASRLAPWRALLICLTTLIITGCNEPQRLTDRQVDELLRLPAETAQASRQLVEHDAKSRAEWLALHESMQAELAQIGRRQEELEARRQELARQRRTDAILAAAIEIGGACLLCVLPAAITALLLWPKKRDESEELCDFLVEAVAEQHHHVRRLEAKNK